ncbi:hypothetical protein K402DRAFT_397825, partial [Aulographum hederae CBS 113979]
MAKKKIFPSFGETIKTTNTNPKTYRGSTVHHRQRRALCQVIRVCLASIDFY